MNELYSPTSSRSLRVGHKLNPSPKPSDDTRSRKNSPYGEGPLYPFRSRLHRHPDPGTSSGSASSRPVTKLQPICQPRSCTDLPSSAATSRPAASRPSRTSDPGWRYSRPAWSTPGFRSGGEWVNRYSPPPYTLQDRKSTRLNSSHITIS